MPSDRAIVNRLREVVGSRVVDDREVIASYTTDWTGRFRGRSAAVVRPGSTEEVAGIVLACKELGVALVPQGGNTGLVGGSVPLHDEVVLSLQRLNEQEPIDTVAGQVTAGAGVVLSALCRSATAAGWAYGIDLASRDSATVGGMVATNAGGTRVLRYGDTRAQLIGLEAVLGTGAVVSHLGGLVKDNTGYHLPGLVCGSEGTLAVVTAARLRLVPAMPCRTVAILAFSAVTYALDASVVLRRSLPALEACELFLGPGVELVCTVTGLRAPFPPLTRRICWSRRLTTSTPPGLWGKRPTPSTTWTTRWWPPIRPVAPSCGVTARPIPRPSTRLALRTSSTCPYLSAHWLISSTRSLHV